MEKEFDVISRSFFFLPIPHTHYPISIIPYPISQKKFAHVQNFYYLCSRNVQRHID